MAQPLLRAYSSDGTTLIEVMDPLDSPTGDTSTPQAFRFVNDDVDGAVDTALVPAIGVREVDSAHGDQVVERGLRAVDERWIQMRAIGTGSPTGTHSSTGWTPVGRGRQLITPALASGEWHDMEVLFGPPFSAPEGNVSFVFTADDNLRTIPLESGHSESSRDGLLNGIGDGGHTELVYGATFTATGTPDAVVHFPDYIWTAVGVPYALLAANVTMSNLDGSAVALGASEAYWARYSLGVGTLTQTKSDLFPSGSPDTADIPVCPDGELNLGYAFVTDALTIGPSDLVYEALVGRASFANNSGRVLTVGPRAARIDNAILPLGVTSDNITLDASQTFVHVWLLPDNTLAATNDGSRPSPRAYKLCKVPTGVSSITMADLVDYRDCIGAERQAHRFFFPGTATAAVKAYGVHRSARTGYIRTPRGMILAANSLGSGNATSDELRVNFKINGTTVFTSGFGAGSLAPGFGGPGLAFPTSNQVDTAAFPEVLEVPPFAVFEAEMTIPNAFAGTAPSDLTLDVTIEVP